MPNWESMWASGLGRGQAFDANRCEPAFIKLLSTASDLPVGKAFVPGCGRGYAVAELCRRGYDATGLDIAPTAVKAANDYLASGEESGIQGRPWRVVAEDFFQHEGTYDLIYDCTFLCALPPELRTSWASKCAELLKPKGELVTLIFPVADPPYEGGPPFCMSPQLVTDLLKPAGFEPLSMSEVPEADLARSNRGLAGSKEYIARWRHGA
jgi:SAM-dependent methyltransferase